MYLSINSQLANTSDNPQALDRGYLLGEGVFETLLCTHGNIEYFNEHMQRLQHGAAAIGITWPELDIEPACQQLLKNNNLLHTSAVLRLTLTQQATQRGLLCDSGSSRLMITANNYDKQRSAIAPKLMISEHIINEYSALCRFKTTSYLEHILAKRNTVNHGFDEALLCNTKGHVCCTTIGNVFILINDTLITPPLSDGILPGIIREKIIETCRKNNTPLQVRSISKNELITADCIFQTNSLVKIQRFCCVGSRPLKPLPNELNLILQGI